MTSEPKPVGEIPKWAMDAGYKCFDEMIEARMDDRHSVSSETFARIIANAAPDEGAIRRDDVIVEVCVIEPSSPFICAVNGRVTVDILGTIEKEIKEEDANWNGYETVTFRASYQEGDFSEGGYAPYWELEELSREHGGPP